MAGQKPKKGAKTLHVPVSHAPQLGGGKRDFKKKKELALKNKNKKNKGKQQDEEKKKQVSTAPAPVETPQNPVEPKGSMVKHVGVAQSQAAQKMTNRQKCLVLGSANMSAKVRHLMLDLRGMLPQCRGHEKVQSRDYTPDTLKEVCALHHCNSCVFMEGRKRGTTFMWLTQMPAGPSIKFELVNVHTADELRMAGNCLKYSRALLHFDHEFEVEPELRIAKSMLTNLFNVPRYHPKSKPFIDHMVCFFYLDERIWIRHYQMVVPHPQTPNKKREGVQNEDVEVELEEEGPTAAEVSQKLYHATKSELEQMKLMEIGPRMVLNPLTILNGAFAGAVIYKNVDAQSPTEQRMGRKMRQRIRMEENLRVAAQSMRHKEENPAPVEDPLAHVFA